MSKERSEVVRKCPRDRNYGTLRVRLNRDFETFGEQEREQFVSKLQQLTGLDDQDIRKVIFRKGCVISEIELPTVVMRKIIQYYESPETHLSADEARLWQEFISEFDIKDISDTTPYTVNLNVKKKTERDSRDHVVFIHGVTGSSASFGKLPTYIENAVGCCSIIYEYPTKRLGGSPAVPFLAMNFDNWVREVAEYAPKLAFVAHSMGGLVVRKFITDQRHHEPDDRLDTRVKQISLVASPEDGSLLARIATKLSKNEQFRDLSPDSTMLLELNREWDRWVKVHVPNDCKVRCIVGLDDSLVPINAARGIDPNPIPLFGVDHRTIVKPSSSNDEIVRTISRLLREAGIGSSSEIVHNKAN